MYERLDKLRTELVRARKKRADADAKVKQLEAKLKEAENAQIITDVGAMNLSPEQVGELMDLIRKGGIPALYAAMARPESAIGKTTEYGNEEKETEEINDESEDEEDEV